MNNALKILSSFRILVLIIAMALFGTTGLVRAECAKIKPTRLGEVYLIRGLDNIFSLGLNSSGKNFSKMGIENCVINHKHWLQLCKCPTSHGFKLLGCNVTGQSNGESRQIAI